MSKAGDVASCSFDTVLGDVVPISLTPSPSRSPGDSFVHAPSLPSLLTPALLCCCRLPATRPQRSSRPQAAERRSVRSRCRNSLCLGKRVVPATSLVFDEEKKKKIIKKFSQPNGARHRTCPSCRPVRHRLSPLLRLETRRSSSTATRPASLSCHDGPDRARVLRCLCKFRGWQAASPGAAILSLLSV